MRLWHSDRVHALYPSSAGLDPPAPRSNNETIEINTLCLGIMLDLNN